MIFQATKTEIIYVQNGLAKKWFFVAIFSLAFSGILAFILSIARIPIIHNYFSDPDFFRRGLVVHVNFGFLIWLSSFGVGIFSLLNNNSKKTLSFFISILGIILLGISWLFIKGQAILSNYIPMIDDPIFFLGIFLFTTGIFLSFFDYRSFINVGHSFLPKISISFIKVFAISYIIAYELGILSFLTTPNSLPSKEYYEILFWGSGHIFVFAIEALKISLWFAILKLVFKQEFKYNSFLKLIAILYLIIPLSSLLLVQHNTFSSNYRNFFTEIMRWGIFPFVSLIILYIVIYTIKWLKVYKIDNKREYIHLISVYLSIFMTIFGFLLGSFIRSSNTMIPAHYHASIGAITLTLMSFSFVFLEYQNWNVTLFEKNKIYYYQPIIYAIGQTIFASGFAIAGINGQGRKLYGSEQQVKGLLDYIGLSLVGIGGIIAVFAGILFIYLFLKVFLPIFQKQILYTFKRLMSFLKSFKVNYKEVNYGEASNSEIHG